MASGSCFWLNGWLLPPLKELSLCIVSLVAPVALPSLWGASDRLFFCFISVSALRIIAWFGSSFGLNGKHLMLFRRLLCWSVWSLLAWLAVGLSSTSTMPSFFSSFYFCTTRVILGLAMNWLSSRENFELLESCAFSRDLPRYFVWACPFGSCWWLRVARLY